jgi:hypothetical protein
MSRIERIAMLTSAANDVPGPMVTPGTGRIRADVRAPRSAVVTEPTA